MVEGLHHADARALLGSVVRWPLDERVADRLVAETRGNPLALLELPRGISPAELAGGFGSPEAAAIAGRIQENFLSRAGSLPEQARLLLAVAAADPTGDPALVHRAAGRLRLGAAAAEQAEETGLIDIGGIGGQVVFRHPLMRRAAYGPSHAAIAGRRTPRWPRRPTRRLIPIDGPGTWRRRRLALMRGRGGSRAFGRAGAGTRGPGRSRSFPGALGGADRRAAAPSRAHPSRGAGQHPGWRVQSGSRFAGLGRERAAG